MSKKRVLVLVQESLVPPETVESELTTQSAPWRAEYDVVTALKTLGHDVRPLGVGSDLGAIREGVNEWKPDLIFNLLEEFHGWEINVPYVMGYFELIRQPYTGCNPAGLMLSASKPLQKKLFRYHRIRIPDFAIFPMDRAIRRPRRLQFPLIVKSATEHGSVGISQASLVNDDDKLVERVRFIHEQRHTDAIAEQFIEGRELYVSLLGNDRLNAFPIWELCFENLPDGAPMIATERAKWNLKYQKKMGIVSRAATDLPKEVSDQVLRICRRAFRALGQSGYSRIDLRLEPDGKVWLIESNPNPQLARGEDFAESARAVGIEYEALIDRIVRLGFCHRPHWDD